MGIPFPITISRLAHLLGKYFVVALIGCYVLAMLNPELAVWISQRRFDVGPLHGSLQTALLAIALFVSACAAAIRTRPDQRRSDSNVPATTRAGLFEKSQVIAGYLATRTLLLACGLFLLWLQPRSSLAFGFVFILAMPAAVSSVPWTYRLKGNVRLILILLIASTLLTPLTWILSEPIIISAMSSLPDETLQAPIDVETSREIVSHSTSTNSATTDPKAAIQKLGAQLPLIQWLWFAPPILGGFLVGQTKFMQRLGKHTDALRIISSLIILLLNFGNAGRLAEYISSVELYAAFGLASAQAIVVSLVALTLGSLLSRLLRQPRENQVALGFAMGMFNTGMAMVLVATALPNRPEILIPIMVFTLTQHLVASCGGQIFRWTQQPIKQTIGEPATNNTSPDILMNSHVEQSTAH